jgi:hypothetical protein
MPAESAVPPVTPEARERLLEWARIEDGMPWAADVRRAVADRLGENPLAERGDRARGGSPEGEGVNESAP